MKKLFTLFVAALLTANLSAERKEVHILSANDMHAQIAYMPALADIADSLRTLYPGLLVFSAGDNRTGDPLNDMNEIPAYPMVALMNQIGFNATTLGNHEFDSSPRGLAASSHCLISVISAPTHMRMILLASICSPVRPST